MATKLQCNRLFHRVSLKRDGTDGTAGLVADGTDYKDGTAIQLLVEHTEQPIHMGHYVAVYMCLICTCR